MISSRDADWFDEQAQSGKLTPDEIDMLEQTGVITPEEAALAREAVEGNVRVSGPNGNLPPGYTRNPDGTISGPGAPGGQRAIFRETGEFDANGNPIYERQSGGYFSVDQNGRQTRINASDLPASLQSRGDAPWQQSQSYIQEQVGGGEVSHLNGEEVPHGTAGSVRPDAVPEGLNQSYEVKNYDLSGQANRNNLVSTTVEQINERATHLPADMQQNIVIDITGQNVSQSVMDSVSDDIVNGSNGAVTKENIDFFNRD